MSQRRAPAARRKAADSKGLERDNRAKGGAVKKSKKANEIPSTLRLMNSDKDHHEYREFLIECKNFDQRHLEIDRISFPCCIARMRSPAMPDAATTTEKWIEETLQSATRFITDTMFLDAEGSPFLLYIRHSLSQADISLLTSATTEFCGLQKASSKLDDSPRYKKSKHCSVCSPGFYDFTSVELGHGCKGIQLSQESVHCKTNAALANYANFSEATLSALRVASIMYYRLAQSEDLDQNTHNNFIKLANVTFQESNGFVRFMLGKPWSPFAQRRLICNLNSLPHVDGNNDYLSLNSLTFCGNAKLWLVVIIDGKAYAFKVAAGATILFPASLFVHFSAGWKGGERYVLTNWTSNQLGYRAILQLSNSTID